MLFDEWNKYLNPYQSARFLAPMCLLYRNGAEIRSTKGVPLISACYLYKRHLSTEAINQVPNSPPLPKPKSCPRTSGTRLQTYTRLEWATRPSSSSNNWCDYSQMEEKINNCQSPSDWGSMQDLTSWSFNDHENGEGSAQNYTGGSCQWSQGSWENSHQENNW